MAAAGVFAFPAMMSLTCWRWSLATGLAAVESPEVLDDAAVIGLGDVLDVEKVWRAIIGNAEFVEASRLGPVLCADVLDLLLHALIRRPILGHEVQRVGEAGQIGGKA